MPAAGVCPAAWAPMRCLLAHTLCGTSGKGWADCRVPASEACQLTALTLCARGPACQRSMY